ncbi:MAG TPA: dual specificity protein phosphatase family protein [Candidatus Obscuribacterales bacterium]
MNYTVLTPEIIVGSYPESPADVAALTKSLGMTAVLNLQTEEDMAYLKLDWDVMQAHYDRHGIEVRRVPVRDFDPIDLKRKLAACVDTLSELIESGHKVYVHCTAGCGRSPTVVVAYLHWQCGWDLDEAAAYVRQRRPSVPNIEAIRLSGQDRGRAG